MTSINLPHNIVVRRERVGSMEAEERASVCVVCVFFNLLTTQM